MRMIKQRKIVDDSWVHALSTEQLPPDGTDVFVSTALWRQARDQLLSRSARLGLRLASDDGPEDFADDLQHFAAVAVEFPKFTDGRGYSTGRLLRDRYQFSGELRAVGAVLRDQLAYMERCGFDAFELQSNKDLDEALGGFDEIGVKYQGASDDPRPLFRRRHAS